MKRVVAILGVLIWGLILGVQVASAGVVAEHGNFNGLGGWEFQVSNKY